MPEIEMKTQFTRPEHDPGEAPHQPTEMSIHLGGVCVNCVRAAELDHWVGIRSHLTPEKLMELIEDKLGTGGECAHTPGALTVTDIKARA